MNDELRPLVRMTVPRRARGLTLDHAPLGTPAFASWLLAGGLVPFDRHRLTLVRVDAGGPPYGFLERSSSLAHALWEHERTVASDGAGGTVVTDRVLVRPRVPALAPAIRPLVRRVFAHRHRRLARRLSARS